MRCWLNFTILGFSHRFSMLMDATLLSFGTENCRFSQGPGSDAAPSIEVPSQIALTSEVWSQQSPQETESGISKWSWCPGVKSLVFFDMFFRTLFPCFSFVTQQASKVGFQHMFCKQGVDKKKLEVAVFPRFQWPRWWSDSNNNRWESFPFILAWVVESWKLNLNANLLNQCPWARKNLNHDCCDGSFSMSHFLHQPGNNNL